MIDMPFMSKKTNWLLLYILYMLLFVFIVFSQSDAICSLDSFRLKHFISLAFSWMDC
jgi:hypothetical protein